MDPPTPQAGSGLYLANSNREFGGLFGVVSCLFGLKSPPRKKCAQWRLHADFRSKKYFSIPNKPLNYSMDWARSIMDSASQLAGSGDELGPIFASGPRRQMVLNFLSGLMFTLEVEVEDRCVL
jgi:hypothetical protein